MEPFKVLSEIMLFWLLLRIDGKWQFVIADKLNSIQIHILTLMLLRRKTIDEHHITFFYWYPILKWRFCNLREVDILLMACLLSLTGHYWVKGVDGWATRSKLFLFLANNPWKPEGTPQFKATTAVCAATFRLSIFKSVINR